MENKKNIQLSIQLRMSRPLAFRGLMLNGRNCPKWGHSKSIMLHFWKQLFLSNYFSPTISIKNLSPPKRSMTKIHGWSSSNILHKALIARLTRHFDILISWRSYHICNFPPIYILAKPSIYPKILIILIRFIIMKNYQKFTSKFILNET